MNKKLLYKKAYRILEKSTPLKIDCGVLCGKACCKGDQDTGMYLFPGEEEMLSQADDFISIKPTKLYSRYGTPIKLAVCQSWCRRNLRPLSCRIFPLAPYISDNGILDVITDPRAKALCPLAAYEDFIQIDPSFKKKVRKVFRMLAQDDEIREFILNLSKILDTYRLW